MRIWFLSDLHLTLDEAASFHVPGSVPDADLCVMPGDLCRSMALGMRWLSKIVRPRMPVVYVPGNHDFYDTSIDEGLMAGRAVAEMGGITFLDGEAMEFGNIRFVGGTLWADFALYAQGGPLEREARIAADMEAARTKSDFRRIRLSNDETKSDRFRFLQPEDSRALHAECLSRIETALAEPFDGLSVVVTHHAPHPGSVDPAFEGANTSSYVSDLSTVIRRHEPAFWLHGHVHQKYDYMAGNTRIVCNPRGYAHEAPAFEWGKVMDIDGP